jgi:hypothetical protein
MSLQWYLTNLRPWVEITMVLPFPIDVHCWEAKLFKGSICHLQRNKSFFYFKGNFISNQSNFLIKKQY